MVLVSFGNSVYSRKGIYKRGVSRWKERKKFMKKRILVVLSSVFLCSLIVACSNANPSGDDTDSKSSVEDADIRKEKNDFDAATNTTETFWGYDISFPSSWDGGNNTLDTKTYYAESGDAIAMFQMQCMDSSFANFDELYSQKDAFIESYGESFDAFGILDSSEYAVADSKGILFYYSAATSGLAMRGKMLVYVSETGNNLICFQMLQSNNTEYSYFDDFEKILDSVTLSRSDVSEPAGDNASDPSDTVPLEYQNALSKAHDYLEYTAFSYSGLIDQLEYEKFSAEAATYAADNCGADWNEQAAKKAQNYLDFSSFSRQGLIDQLVYEGFTNEQAEYGVSAVGY